jgi:hypothetical protein
VCLGRVLDDQQTVGTGQLHDGRHVHSSTKEVHRNDAAHRRRERRFERLDSHQLRLGIYVGEAWTGAHKADRLCRGDERVGRNHHLVVGPDLKGPQGQDERLGPGGYAHRVGNFAPGGIVGLELFDRGATRESAGGRHILDSGHELAEQLRIVVIHHGQRNSCGCVEAHAAVVGTGSRGSPPRARMPMPKPRSGSRMRFTASLRERTPSLPNAEERWLLTVLSARNSCSAI